MAYSPKNWSNGMVIDASDLNKIEQGIAEKAQKGDKGDLGTAGKNGVTPNITLTVSKLAAGQNPTVTKSGTAEAPTFALGIPEGAKGANGTNGANGKSVKAIALTTNTEGKVTGGTCTLSDNSTIQITVTVAGA